MEKYVVAYLARPSFENAELIVTHCLYHPEEVKNINNLLMLALISNACKKCQNSVINWYGA